MTIAQYLFGQNNLRARIVSALILRRLNDEGEFGAFFRDHEMQGERWAEWVKESPTLREEAEILWSHLLIVAEMQDDDFGVPIRMIRQWYKALAGRLITNQP